MTFVSDRRPRSRRVASCRASGQSKLELGLRWKVGTGRLGDMQPQWILAALAAAKQNQQAVCF